LGDDAAEALLPVDAPLLATLFPSLRAVKSVARTTFQAPALDPQELRHRVRLAVRELFVRLAQRRPVVLLVDDLQWSAADSRAAAAEVMRGPKAPPILAICTLRTSPKDPGFLERSVGFLSGVAHLERSQLGPLPGDEARALASRLLGGEDGRAAAIAEEA